ncbi:LOW QUALITY PROTEIN: proline-, glutamic acid- and leucine-rich protein 1 [Harpegnathos saltator]|nr:LOW QUALITY PROTEIN: proline-, glutamic acid- and leucine-rich protein 1 [Harpegnathos saltator]
MKHSLREHAEDDDEPRGRMAALVSWRASERASERAQNTIPAGRWKVGWLACCPCHRNFNGDISIRTRRRGVVHGSVRHKRAGTTPRVPTTVATRDTAMRVAVILLACVAALCSAQFQDGQRSLPSPIRATRYQRLPPPRPSSGPQSSIFPNQRIRRPITFKPRGASDDAPGTFRPLRPSLPIAPPFAQHVKPVNEEPEEEDVARESTRERDNDDSRDHSQEPESEEEVSEENLPPRPASNLARTPPGGSPAPVLFRPVQSVTPSSIRGSPATPPPPPPIQYRPTQKPTKAPRKQVVDDAYKQPIKPPPKPVKPSQAYEIRGKKPVAQIVRRYRHDNADGSITWGFENDDGSYKEETIGVDCITSGKYGYIDPDGIRREYTYETGIRCDEEEREEEEDGFVDYQENKLVLPDGKTIDLSSMGKKQARRPQFQYRN